MICSINILNVLLVLSKSFPFSDNFLSSFSVWRTLEQSSDEFELGKETP